jgi:signal peptidase I
MTRIQKRRILGWGVLFLFLSVLVYFFRIYRIDGTSMNYGLVDGDVVISTTHFGTIERGELFVIRHPEDPYGRLYIKRCTALPGDRYFEKARLFYLQLEGNTTKTRHFAVAHGLKLADTPDGYFLKEPYARYYGVVHDWRLIVPEELTTLPLKVVEEGHYLMMGDFRDNSADSRFFGAVPREWVLSKVVLIWKYPRSWKELLSIKEAD